MGNTALPTENNGIHAVGDLIPFLRVNVFLLYRPQHQLFNVSLKNVLTQVRLLVSFSSYSLSVCSKKQH